MVTDTNDEAIESVATTVPTIPHDHIPHRILATKIDTPPCVAVPVCVRARSAGIVSVGVAINSAA
jgi:hypothetical protein